MPAPQPSIWIGGPTASGKTSVAVEVALRVGGEVICADSRTVYRGLSVGTAKPTTAEQRGVRHWALDMVDPDERYSAHQFKRLAQEAMRDIWARGRVPIVVGGTGLYIDSVLYDIEMMAPSDGARRAELESYAVEALQAEIARSGLSLPENSRNRRHLINCLERQGRAGSRREAPIDGSIVVAIATDDDELRSRIRDRAATMFDDPELYAEATRAAERYGWDAPGLSGNIYRIVRRLLAGELTKPEAIEAFVILDWQLARRQRTWLRRSPHLTWLPREEAAPWILGQLQNTVY
jgi:tRNA dimethylallyltransferase